MKYKIIIDTDIGDDIDDAFALLLALAFKEVEIIGITTVFKNTLQRAKIVKKILELSGKNNIPVFCGNDIPLNGHIEKWSYEEKMDNGKIKIHHYDDSMNNQIINEGTAEDFILNMAEKYPNEVTLVAIGPFTNVAKAYLKNKESFLKLKQAYIMGGQPAGNYKEWNIKVDPYAAKVFFESGIKINCVGLDLTTQCKLNNLQIDMIDNNQNPVVKLVDKMMKVWIETHNDKELKRYPTMHDPLCVLSMIYDDICNFKNTKVNVIDEGENAGLTITDKVGAEINIGYNLNLETFYKHFFELLNLF